MASLLLLWRILHSLYRLSFPGGFLLLGLWLLAERSGRPEAVAQLGRVWPWTVLGAAMLLAWWFHQLRLLVALIALLLASRALSLIQGIELGVAPLFFGLLGLLLALNQLWILFLRDRGRLSWRTSGSVVALLLQAALFALLLSSAATQAQQAVVSWAATLPKPLHEIGLVALLVPAVGALLRAAVLGDAGDRGLFWAQLATLLAFASAGVDVARNLYLSGAGAILLLTILESSYHLAYRDELTRLPSRRAMNEALEDLGDTYAIALLDIDHFKQVNDRHGHEVGDQVLAAVAARLQRVGGGGRPFRYGGEEFALLFPGQKLADAVPRLEELRETIAGTPFTLREPGRPRHKPKRTAKSRRRKRPRTLSVTVSIGVAQRSARRPDPESVLQAADKALYRAKRGGRNQVRK